MPCWGGVESVDCRVGRQGGGELLCEAVGGLAAQGPVMQATIGIGSCAEVSAAYADVHMWAACCKPRSLSCNPLVPQRLQLKQVLVQLRLTGAGKVKRYWKKATEVAGAVVLRASWGVWVSVGSRAGGDVLI